MEKITKERAIEFILEVINVLRNEKEERFYICTCLYQMDIYHTAQEEVGWEHLIHSYMSIAREKFAGDYWNYKGKFKTWWIITKAQNDSKLQEVYALKIKFLEYILKDIQK